MSELDDEVLVAIVIEGSQGDLRRHLTANHHTFDTYMKLRKYIDEYFDCSRAFVLPAQAGAKRKEQHVAMEVDGLNKGSKKGGSKFGRR